MDKNTYLINLSESSRTDCGKVAFSDQGPEQRFFSSVWALESQVNNGGFAQYFISAEGDTAASVPDALRTIGAERCADIVERALRIAVPSGDLPSSQADREAIVDSLSADAVDKLDALDAEFFAYPDNLSDLLFAFVARHPAIFGRADA